MHIYSYVKYFIKIDDGRKPARGKEARIGKHIQRAREFFSQPQARRVYLERGWSDGILQFQKTVGVNVLRKNRSNLIFPLAFFFTEYV